MERKKNWEMKVNGEKKMKEGGGKGNLIIDSYVMQSFAALFANIHSL